MREDERDILYDITDTLILMEESWNDISRFDIISKIKFRHLQKRLIKTLKSIDWNVINLKFIYSFIYFYNVSKRFSISPKDMKFIVNSNSITINYTGGDFTTIRFNVNYPISANVTCRSNWKMEADLVPTNEDIVNMDVKNSYEKMKKDIYEYIILVIRDSFRDKKKEKPRRVGING